MKSLLEKTEQNRIGFANYSMALGYLVIFFLASLLITSTITFFLGGSIGRSQFIASVIMALGLSFDLVNTIKIDGGGKNVGLKLLGSLSILTIIALAIETPIYDISFDGQNYHQEGIIQLKEGWNPHVTQLPTTIHPFTRLFTQHFAKGTWYMDSCIYSITGHIQSGKATNILLIVSSFLVTLSVILKLTKLTFWESALFSSLLSFNPVWACQYLSFYVDGQISSCLLILICSFVALEKQLYNKYMLLLLSAISLMILVNLKFTGIIYGTILSLGFILIQVIRRRTQEALENTAFLGFAGLIGVLCIGYGTYVINQTQFGHPFYPIYGASSSFQTFFDASIPSNFKNSNSFISFLRSLFSQSGLIETQANAILKLPFTISWDELKIFVREEPRTSGFGPLFSGCILLSLFLLTLVIWFEKVKPQVELQVACLFILLSVIIIPANWWARYIPQFYFLILLIPLWVVAKTKKKLLKTFALLITLLFCLNTGLIWGIYTINSIQKTLKINDQITFYKNRNVLADFGIFQATRMRFIEHNIPFEEVTREKLYHDCYSPAIDLVCTYNSVKICIKK